MAAGGGLFGAVFIAVPFFNALGDLWWAMGYSSGMLFTGRCKDSSWHDEDAPPDWTDLLRARNLAADLFKRAYLPEPAWLSLAFGYGTLVLTVSTALAQATLVALPSNRYVEVATLAGNAATMGGGLLYVFFLAAHRSRFRHGWKRNRVFVEQAGEVVELLGGWGNLGHRVLTNCAGTGRFAPGPWATVSGLTVSLAFTLAIRLWPYRHFLALSAAAALVLFVLALVVWWHIRALRQALHPERYSPCVSLPLALLLRDAAMALYGITPRALYAQLRPAIGGEVVTRMPQGNYHLNLYLRLADTPHLGLDGLSALLMRTDKGWTPLGTLAHLKLEAGPNQIRHLNGARALDILATPTGPLGATVSAARAALKGLKMPPGYRVEFGGLFARLEKAAADLGIAALGAFVLMVGILMLQFDGIRLPAILLLQMPLAFTGAARRWPRAARGSTPSAWSVSSPSSGSASTTASCCCTARGTTNATAWMPRPRSARRCGCAFARSC